MHARGACWKGTSGKIADLPSSAANIRTTPLPRQAQFPGSNTRNFQLIPANAPLSNRRVLFCRFPVFAQVGESVPESPPGHHSV